MDGERQAIEPMASRLRGADVQALRQFVGQSPWAVEAVQRRLDQKVVDLLNKPEVWIIAETAFPKAGTHSVGVARQDCGTLGKVANCQVAISLHWSSAEASCPLHWRRYVPKAWVEDAPRAAHVKLPPGRLYRGKTPLALDLIDQGRIGEVPGLPVVADAFYGNEVGFRQALRQQQVPEVVAVESSTGVWTEDPNVPLPPPKKTGRPRQFPPLAALSRPKSLKMVAQELPPRAWKHVTWRAGKPGGPNVRG
jgi:SRSO17 transposase